MKPFKLPGLFAIVTIIALIVCTTVAFATYMDVPLPPNGNDEKGGYFALEALSDADNPATPWVEVNVGSPMTVRLKVDIIAEEGFVAPPFPIPFNVYLYMLKDGKVVASQASEFSLSMYSVAKGGTYHFQESRSINVPADLAPGDYVLTAHTYFDVPQWLIDAVMQNGPSPAPTPESGEIPDAIGATKSWPVIVVNDHYAGTPSPTPLPPNNTVVSTGDMSFGSDFLNGIMGSPGTHSITGNGFNGMLTVGTGKGDAALQLTTDDISAPGLNGAGASIKVNFSRAPDDGVIEMSLLPEPSPDVETQYALGAIDSNYDITAIAYVLVVNKTNIRNTEYTLVDGNLEKVKDGEVINAVITMKVSPGWVSAHGGTDAIKIMRYDNGKAEALETHYLGYEGDLMVFEGISPKGLSVFAMCAVRSLSEIAHDEAVAHPPGLIYLSLWQKLVAMVLVGGILLIQLVLAVFTGLGLVAIKVIRKRKK